MWLVEDNWRIRLKIPIGKEKMTDSCEAVGNNFWGANVQRLPTRLMGANPSTYLVSTGLENHHG